MLVAASITWTSLMLIRKGALDPFVSALGFGKPLEGRRAGKRSNGVMSSIDVCQFVSLLFQQSVTVPTGGVLAVWIGLQTIVITRGLLGFARLNSKRSPLALHPK